MRTYITQTFILAATILIMCIVAMLAFVSNETFESNYHSLEEAIADRAIERGWIPSWLPNSAKQIREIHDIDSNRVYIAFEYDESDRDWFTRPCIQLAETPENPNPRLDWWLRPAAGGDAWRDHAFFTCSNREFKYDLFLAIDKINQHAFLWTAARY